MTSTYLAWVSGSRTRGEWNTFIVRDDLAPLGIDVWAPMALEIERVGKRREWTSEDVPALSGYVFAECEPEQFRDLVGHKMVTPTVQVLSRLDRAQLAVYRQRIEDESAEARRATASRRAMCAYQKGDRVTLQGTALGDTLWQFSRLIEEGYSGLPVLELTGDMMGQEVTVQADPIDVKKAG